MFCQVEITDEYEPLEEGLDKAEIWRASLSFLGDEISTQPMVTSRNLKYSLANHKETHDS